MIERIRKIQEKMEVNEIEYGLRKSSYMEELKTLILGNKDTIGQNELDYFYWETDFSTEIIARALGTYGGNLHNCVSKNYPCALPCSGCGQEIKFYPKSRTDLRKSESDGIFCNGCLEIKRQERNKYIEMSNSHAENYKKELQHLKQMPYSEYLKTDHWQEVRRKSIKRSGFKCQLCNEEGVLNVHHRTYENRGQEGYLDVIVLCADCHGKFHNKLTISR